MHKYESVLRYRCSVAGTWGNRTVATHATMPEGHTNHCNYLETATFYSHIIRMLLYEYACKQTVFVA
jgi:hypothetical protein